MVVHSIQVVDRYCEFSTNVEHTTRLLYPSNLFRVTFIGNGYFVNKYNISSSMIQDVFFSLSLTPLRPRQLYTVGGGLERAVH